MPKPSTAPPNAPLTLPAAPGNSEAVGVAAGVLTGVLLAPPGETNWAVVAIAGMLMELVSGTPAADVNGTSVPTADAPEKAGVGVAAGAGFSTSSSGLSTLWY
jgi:hypothetical protein